MQVLDVKLDDEMPASPPHSVTPSEHVKFSEDQVDADVPLNGTGYYQHHQPNDYYDDSESQNGQQYFRDHQRHLQQPTPQPQSRVSPIPYYNKRATGKKNISSIVVGQNDIIEFDQMDDKGFGVVKINRPIGVSSRSSTHEHLNDNESVHSRDSEHTHTQDGFFDLKFYHNRLW